MNARVPAGHDHLIILDGPVPQPDIVQHIVLKDDNILIYHGQGGGHDFPGDFIRGLPVKQDLA